MAEVYPNKVKNLMGYPLRVSIYPALPYMVHVDKENNASYYGYDGGMYPAIAQFLNATPQLNVGLDAGYEVFVNSTYAVLNGGVTEDLFYKRADLVLNTRVMLSSMFAEFLYPYRMEGVTAFVPKAKMLPKYTNFLATEALFHSAHLQIGSSLNYLHNSSQHPLLPNHSLTCILHLY